MSTIVTAADAAQFLSLVPSMFGFSPRQSLVVVPLARGRTAGALRLDLPADDQADATASTVLGMVCRIPDVDALIAVVYTDDRFETGTELPHRPLADAVHRHAQACGMSVRDSLVVAGDGWGSYLARETPPGGHPLGDLTLRTPVPGAGPVGKDQASGVRLPRSTSAVRTETENALRSLRAAMSTLCAADDDPGVVDRVDPAALEAICELDDVPELYERALSWRPEDLTPMRTAMLAWAMSRPGLRDVALVQWATSLSGGDMAMAAQQRWEEGIAYPPELGEVMWGDAPRPDIDRLETALELVRHVATRTPAVRRAGILSMAAWLSWAMGRSTHADRYARTALRTEPEHGLSEIVLSFVQAGHLPAWAFDRGGDGPI